MAFTSIPLLPGALLFLAGILSGLLVAFIIVMIRKSKRFETAVEPPPPPLMKPNSLPSKPAKPVETKVEDEFQVKSAPNLDMKMKRTMKSTEEQIKRIDQIEQKFGLQNKGSASHSAEEIFVKRVTTGTRVMPTSQSGSSENLTPNSKTKSRIRESPERLIKALRDCAGSNNEVVINNIIGRCSGVNDEIKRGMIELGVATVSVEFLNPNYSTSTRKHAVAFLLSLQKFPALHGRIVQEMSEPPALAHFASYLKSMKEEETSTFPQVARRYLACLFKQWRNGKTKHVGIHDYFIKAATTWVNRANITETNNMKTITAAAELASEFLSDSKSKLIATSADGRAATAGFLLTAINRITSLATLPDNGKSDLKLDAKWTFLSFWEADFTETTLRDKMINLLKVLWANVGIIARDEKMHPMLVDPNQRLIINMKAVVDYFKLGGIQIEYQYPGGFCDRFLDILNELMKTVEGKKVVIEMKDALLVPLTESKKGEGETPATRAGDILKRLGTPAKTPKKQ